MLVTKNLVFQSHRKFLPPTSLRGMGIATATLPRFGKQKGRKSSLKRRGDLLDPVQRRQAQIQELRNKLKDKDQGKIEPVPLAGRVLACPIVPAEEVLSIEEANLQISQLLKLRRTWLQEKLNSIDREWLDMETKLILSGKISNAELVRNMKSKLHLITNEKDREKLNNMLSWYRKTTVQGYFDRFQKEIQSGVSGHTQQILLQATQIPMADFKDKEDRIELQLSVLDQHLRQQFYQTKRDIHSRMRMNSFFAPCRGPSMEPTLWRKCWVVEQELSHGQEQGDKQHVLARLERGSIVSFILFLNDGNTKLLGKRVVGLPGDLVQTAKGKTVQVPPDFFWAVGDNHALSYDSRHFGAVPAQNIKSRYLLAYSSKFPFVRLLV